MGEEASKALVLDQQVTEMTIESAARILRAYNAYIRCDHEPCDPPYTAEEIGEAIDVAVNLLEQSVVRSDIESIIRAVSRETGVTEEEMLSRGRHREYSEARAIVSWLAYHYTTMTLTTIGKRLNRGHASAIYYNKTVSYWLTNRAANPRGRNITNKLIKELGNGNKTYTDDLCRTA